MSEPFAIQPKAMPPIAYPPMVFDGQRYPMRWVSTEATPNAVVVTVMCYDGKYCCSVLVPFSYDESAKYSINADFLDAAFRMADCEYHQRVLRRRENNAKWSGRCGPVKSAS